MRASLAWLLLIALLGAVTADAAGSWIANSLTPKLTRRGWRYTTPKLTPRPTTPTAGRGITSVAWRYGFHRPHDPNLHVALCGGGRCINASTPRGSSHAFAGLPVKTPVRFYFLLPGRGRLTRRLYSAPLQLVVNFR
jgi:hypothetical protein